MVKTLPERAQRESNSVNPAPKGKPGRPLTNAGLTVSVRLSLNTARRVHGALLAGANEARKASIKNQLTDAAAGLALLLGPRLDPAWAPPAKAERGANAIGYRVVNADGTDSTVPTVRQAAALAGIRPQSLAVLLSRGRGTYRRKRGDSAITITRILA